MSEFSNIPQEHILGTNQGTTGSDYHGTGSTSEYPKEFYGAMDVGQVHPKPENMPPVDDLEIASELEDDDEDDDDDGGSSDEHSKSLSEVGDDEMSEAESTKEGSGGDDDDDGESESQPSKDCSREEDGDQGSEFTKTNTKTNRESGGESGSSTAHSEDERAVDSTSKDDDGDCAREDSEGGSRHHISGLTYNQSKRDIRVLDRSIQDEDHDKKGVDTDGKEAGNLHLLSVAAQSSDDFNENVLPAQKNKDPENESKDDRIECDICKMSFSNSGNYSRHVASHDKEVIRNEGEDDRSHSCPECGKSYLNKAHLKEHLLKHTDDRPFQCPVCNRGFFRGPVLKKHLEIHSATHPFVKNYEVKRIKKPKAKHACDECGKVYPFKSRLEEHMMRHLGEKPMSCKICSKGFFRKGELKKHMKTHGADGVVEEEEKRRGTRTSPRGKKRHKEQCHTCVCKDCGKVMTHPQSPLEPKAPLNPRTQTKSRKPTKPQKPAKPQKPLKAQKVQFIKVQAQQPVDESTDMRDVMDASDPGNNRTDHRVPNIVGESSKQSQDIECETQHNVEEADPQKRPPKVAWTKDDLTCQHCGKLFDTRKKWREHQKCHKTDKPFLCSICGKSFLSNGLYKNHLVSHSDEKPFGCDYCGQHFKQKFNLKHHIKMRHIASKSFLCHLCGNAYTSNSSLQIHLQIHSGQKPFQCQHCPKSFTLKSNLREHLRYHSEDRPYKCNLCNADFRVSGTLKLHMRSHTGEKPYACSVCARTFAVKGTLKDHMRIHTGEKPHKCDVCGKQFSQKAGLYSHKKTHVKEIEKAMFVPPVFY